MLSIFKTDNITDAIQIEVQRTSCLQFYNISKPFWCGIFQHRYARVFLSKPWVTLFFSGWCDAMDYLALSHLDLPCMVQNKPLPYMFITVGKTGCKWFAQCPWGCYTYIYLQIMVCWKLSKTRTKQDDLRPDSTRQGGTQTRRFPWFQKIQLSEHNGSLSHRDNIWVFLLTLWGFGSSLEYVHFKCIIIYHIWSLFETL